MPANSSRLLVLCLILFFSSPAGVYAQRVNPMFYKEVQLERKKTYTLQSLTRTIQEQTGISFSYNATRINPSGKIRLRMDRITVEQLLSVVRKKTGIGYKVISAAHIIYTEPAYRKKKVARGRKRSRRLNIFSNATPEYPEMSLRTIGKDSTAVQQIVIIGDSAVAGYYFSGGGNSGGGYAGNDQYKYQILLDETEEDGHDDDNGEPGQVYRTAATAGSTALDYFKESTLLSAGIAADEVYFLNPTVRVGFDFLYGTVSYNTGRYSHWRYGLGASAKLNDRWTLHLNVTTGRHFAETFDIQHTDTFPPAQQDSLEQPVIVTTHTPLLVQSRLTRFTLSAEYNLGRGFMLGAGLTLNSLKTSYSSLGNPVKLSDILPVGYDADEKYRTIDPPYLLGNSYSASNTSNTKIWLGLQVILVYRLQFFK